ncbi:site-specific integrase [Listeria monocytogenes]|nr:site-specific integrase [Listeria monocytogenes]
MATIQSYITKSGERFFYQIYEGVDPKTRKPIFKKKRGFLTELDARLAAKNYEDNDGEENKIVDYSKLTFLDVYNEWWKLTSIGLKISTVATYESLFKNHILPVLGNWSIQSITKKDAQTFITDLMALVNDPDIELSRSTVQNIKIKTAQVFKYAIEMDYVGKNAFEFVVVPRSFNDLYAMDDEEQQRDFWYRDELLTMLNYFKEECENNVYMLFRLLVFSGARKGEILALKISDVNFDRSGIHIRKTLFYKKGYHLLKTKNYKTRFIPLDDITIHELNKHIANLIDTTKILAAENIKFNNDNFLFPRSNGEPQRLAMPNDELNKLYKKHPDLLKLKIHSFRHSYASALFAEGKPAKKVQALLGHKSIKETMDTYTHVILDYYDPEIEKDTLPLYNFI